MATNEIISKLNELSELRRMADELNAEIEAIQDEIKATMTEQGAEELNAGEYKIRYALITSNRFDSKAFRASYDALYQQFVKPTVSRRFSVA